MLALELRSVPAAPGRPVRGQRDTSIASPDMCRLMILVALIVAAVGASAGHGAVSVADLRAGDVVFDDGANRPAADRERLQRAADALRAKGFPTKFVVMATAPKDPDRVAADLRKGLAREVGIGNIDAVLVLGHRTLGISANVFQSERSAAFQAEVATLKTDDIAGTINVANRLQQFDEAGALPGETVTKKSDSGVPAALIGVLAAVLVGGLVAIFLIRRAVKRGARSPDATDPPSV